jgi:hypothetical protein
MKYIIETSSYSYIIIDIRSHFGPSTFQQRLSEPRERDSLQPADKSYYAIISSSTQGHQPPFYARSESIATSS